MLALLPSRPRAQPLSPSIMESTVGFVGLNCIHVRFGPSMLKAEWHFKVTFESRWEQASIQDIHLLFRA